MSLLSAFSASRARRTLLAAVSATTIAAGIGAPTSASAIYLPCMKYGTCYPGPKLHYGYGAAALIGGLALGAIAASAASANSCVFEQRQQVGYDGNVYYRTVRVCY